MPAAFVRDLLVAAVDSGFLLRWHLRGMAMRRTAETLPVTHSQPVLLIPGVHESPVFLDPLAAILRTTGRPVHLVRTLGHNNGRILDSAALVAAYLAEQDLRDVSIVAHSKGGLIGKRLMVWEETAPRIRSMVAIASPFAGSRYARRAPILSWRDFSPADRTLRELAANQDANARIVSVFARVDPQIPEGSELPGARNIRLPIWGHFRPLGDPRVHRILCRELVRELQ